MKFKFKNFLVRKIFVKKIKVQAFNRPKICIDIQAQKSCPAKKS